MEKSWKQMYLKLLTIVASEDICFLFIHLLLFDFFYYLLYTYYII